jgi:gliding motility-associated-like protein
VVGNIPSPDANVMPSDSIICLNETVTFIVGYTGDGVIPSWDFGPAATPRYSTGDVFPITVRYSQPGRWPAKLVVTDNCGKDSVTTYINVFKPPVVDAYPDVYICAPLNHVQFNITPVSDYSYSWTPIFGLSDPSIANPLVSLADTSMVYVRSVKDDITGCITKDTVKVSSHTSFQIHAMNDTSVVAGQEVTLKACCTNYTWSPSTYLNNPGSQNPVATPYSSIWYHVQSIDTIGCIARDSVLITVAILEPFIPNLVTPNGDNLNDTFKIRNLCPGSHVEIYNRWGNLVFKSEDYKNDWNGKNDSDGLYYITFQSGCGGKLYKSWLQVLGSD